MAVYTDISDDELAQLLAAYDLGEAVSFKGVAEGVENAEQLETLEHAGCDSVQGFFFARPASAAAIEAVMRTRPYARTSG